MTYEEGRDAIYNVFRAVWGDDYPIAWPGLPNMPPNDELTWAKVVLKHTDGRQATLAGEHGTRRFSRSGFIVISIFVPVGGGQTKAYQLAQMVSNAYEDAKLDVWFRNTRIREQGASGAFEQIDVLTDFHYDEVR